MGVAHLRQMIEEYSYLVSRQSADKMLIIVTPSLPGFNLSDYLRFSNNRFEKTLTLKIKGTRLYNAQKFKKALQLFQQYEETYDLFDFLNILYLSAISAYNLKNFRLAIKYFDKLIYIIEKYENSKHKSLLQTILYLNFGTNDATIANVISNIFLVRGICKNNIGENGIYDIEEATKRDSTNQNAIRLLKQSSFQTEELLRDKITELFKLNYDLMPISLESIAEGLYETFPRESAIQKLEQKIQEQGWTIQYRKGILKKDRKKTEEAHIWINQNEFFITDKMIQILNLAYEIIGQKNYEKLINEIIKHEKIEAITNRLKALKLLPQNKSLILEKEKLLTEFKILTEQDFDWENIDKISSHDISLKYADDILIKFLDSLFAFETIMDKPTDSPENLKYMAYITHLFSEIIETPLTLYFSNIQTKNRFLQYLKLLEIITKEFKEPVIFGRLLMDIKIFVAEKTLKINLNLYETFSMLNIKSYLCAA